MRKGIEMEAKKYIVTAELSKIRIDKVVLQKETDLSRAMIQKLIEDEKILVNGKKVKSSYKTEINDEIVLLENVPKEIKLEAENIPLEIVYEDADILVINKQKGLVVHPGNGNLNGTLVNAVMGYCKDSLSGIGGEIRPGIVHRIDKDTSGLLIVAKNDKAHINISEQIKNHQVKKTYFALVRGKMKENCATIDMPIARSNKDRTKMAVSKRGKNAVTHFTVRQRFEDFTLLEVTIETGRTHQIRVHLAEIGYPIVGDYVYSNGKNPFGVKGQMLHSYRLEFVHPTTGRNIKLEAPFPQYFQEVLKQLS